MPGSGMIKTGVQWLPVKEVVEDMGSGLVDLHLKIVLSGKCLLSLGIS